MYSPQTQGGYLFPGTFYEGKPAIPWVPFWRTRRWLAHFGFRIGTFITNKIAGPIDEWANNICVDVPRPADPPAMNAFIDLLRVKATMNTKKVEGRQA